MLINRLAKYVVVYFIVVCAESLSAQTQADSTNPTFIQQNFSINGDAGLYGELYGISGINARRPPSTASLYFRPTITLFNAFSMSFDFLLSTEGSSARQEINQYGINPSWGWGNAHLGDFTDVLTPLTFDGIFVRGAGVNLNPGLFRFSAFGGFTQSAVGGGVGNGSYSRFMYGARIGVGKEESSYFDVLFLRSYDKPSSLPSPQASIAVVAPNGNDSWPIGNVENIRWASSGIYGSVKIELSRDGGATYQVLFDSAANSGLQTWIVTGPSTPQAIIRITSLQNSVSGVSSLPFTIGLGIQEQQGSVPGSVANSFAVTPQENLVSGVRGRLALFDNALTISSEIDGSVFTQDMRASQIDSLNLPRILSGLYTPRTSSRADFAYNTEVGLSLSGFNARVGYKYTGPGYMSLGAASLLSDDREITLATAFKLSSLSISINAGHQNDNLLNQKNYTTNRNQIGGNINISISDQWTTSVMSNYMDMSNDAASDTFKVDYSTFMAGMTHTIFLGVNSFLQTMSLSYIYQGSADGNPMRQGDGLTSHSANMSLVFIVASNLDIMPSFSLNDSKIGGGWISTQTYSISAQHRALQNRLTTSLSVGMSKVQENNSLQTALSSSYGITAADAVTLSAMQTFFHGTNNFSEHTLSLNLSHRF